MQRVVILGESNLLTIQLTRLLSDRYQVVLLSRKIIESFGNKNIECKLWDGKSLITDILNGAFAVINLTGDSLLKKRWTNGRRSQILNSRKDAALTVKKSIEQCSDKPSVWIQGSGTMFYGRHSGIIFDETFSTTNKSFLTKVFEQTEKPINELKSNNVRKVLVRIAAIISPQGYLWKRITSLLWLNLVLTPGKGQRYLPWIHLEDAVAAIDFILENENCSGKFNLVSPERCRFKDLARGIYIQYKKLLIIPIPLFLFRLVYGKGRTKELIKINQQVLPQRIQKHGFVFKYDSLEILFSDLINTTKS